LPLSAHDVTPLYWINMGSAAISTAAGATLVAQSALSPLVAELVPFVKGLTLFFWSVASWWIPMLIALGVWRYLICGVPFAYGPLYWGGVFPLGMYSASTYWLAKSVGAAYLMPLSYAFMIVAIIAWIATFVGLVDSVLNWRRAH
jgi:tellurite resistance protein TehA-like permease